jgi:hypothetical protein
MVARAFMEAAAFTAVLAALFADGPTLDAAATLAAAPMDADQLAVAIAAEATSTAVAVSTAEATSMVEADPTVAADTGNFRH